MIDVNNIQVPTCNGCWTEYPDGCPVVPLFSDEPFGPFVTACCLDELLRPPMQFEASEKLGLSAEEVEVFMFVAGGLDAACSEIPIPIEPSYELGMAINGLTESVGQVTYDGWLPGEDGGAVLQFAVRI
jgi:hypothetical protein